MDPQSYTAPTVPQQEPAPQEEKTAGASECKLSVLEKRVIRKAFKPLVGSVMVMAVSADQMELLSATTNDEKLTALAKDIVQSHEKTLDLVDKLVGYVGEEEPKENDATMKRKRSDDEVEDADKAAKTA